MVMVHNVITVRPDTNMADAVKLLADHDVSALPVIDADGYIVGMLSEADLVGRVEIGTALRQGGWLDPLIGASALATQFAKSHGKKVSDVMTERVVAFREDTPISEIAGLFEKQRIKRVPIVRGGKLVGIVSRSNLMQALAPGRAGRDLLRVSLHRFPT